MREAEAARQAVPEVRVEVRQVETVQTLRQPMVMVELILAAGVAEVLHRAHKAHGDLQVAPVLLSHGINLVMFKIL
jgi:hypothetical protein